VISRDGLLYYLLLSLPRTLPLPADPTGADFDTFYSIMIGVEQIHEINQKETHDVNN